MYILLFIYMNGDIFSYYIQNIYMAQISSWWGPIKDFLNF